MQERLQKIISRAGVASRRKAEQLIVQGQVSVNGETVTELGTKADMQRDTIRVGARLIRSKPPALLYLALNKPRGCITTTSDPEGRPTVMTLLGKHRAQVYPVGRLDFNSEGLLVLTNDGDFANRILTAKADVPKTYHVKVNANVKAEQQKEFREGIKLDGRRTAPARIRLLRPGTNPWYEVTLTEGRNQQIRRMFRALGVLVEKLKRVRIGPISLGKLATGDFRTLTDEELAAIRNIPTRKAGRVKTPPKK